MKNVADRTKVRTYEPPRIQIIEIDTPEVLCASALQGASTEAVGLGYFFFP